MRYGKLTLVTLCAIASFTSRVEAQSFTANFPTTSSTTAGHAGFGFANSNKEVGYFFVTGDSVSQTYTGTGLTSANELKLDLTVPFNNLIAVNSGGFVNLDVKLNGTTVGTITRTEANATTPLSLDYLFAPIVGNGTYAVQLIETNNVPVGFGSITIGVGGKLTLNAPAATPEPGSIALLIGLGVSGSAFFARRRRSANKAA